MDDNRYSVIAQLDIKFDKMAVAQAGGKCTVGIFRIAGLESAVSRYQTMLTELLSECHGQLPFICRLFDY